MSKKSLSERDICTKYITPAIEKGGWDIKRQVREEVSFTDGRIIVRGQQHTRGKKKRADYILYYKPNLPIAIVEAKDNKHSIGSGMQQALEYSEILDIPFIFSSNGDGFIFHDKTKTAGNIEVEISLSEFPSPDELWKRYKEYKGINEEEDIVLQDYHTDERGLIPRYYQQVAINRTIEVSLLNESDQTTKSIKLLFDFSGYSIKMDLCKTEATVKKVIRQNETVKININLGKVDPKLCQGNPKVIITAVVFADGTLKRNLLSY